ncbi:unnamed protein product, partial [marine sediment metagenome]
EMEKTLAGCYRIKAKKRGVNNGLYTYYHSCAFNP